MHNTVFSRRGVRGAAAFGSAFALCLAPLVADAAALAVPVPIAGSVPSVAANFQAVPSPSNNARMVGSDNKFVGIALQTAVGMALSHNTSLAISESNRRIANYRVVAARGPYDVKLNVEPSFSYSTQPAISPFQAGPNGGPTTQITSGLTGGFSLDDQSGRHYDATVSGSRTSSNSTANAYNPFFQTAIAFNVTQPLLRGHYTEDMRDLRLAVIAEQSQYATTLQTASSTISDVIDTYWDLVAAWRQLGIQEQAAQQAQAQSASNARLVRRGTSAPVDVVESDTQVDIDQDNVFAAVQTVAQLQNRLKSLLLSDPADPLWHANFVPTSPLAETPPEPALDKVIVAGLVQRPEFASVAAAKRNADIQYAYAKDISRPQLDLRLGYRRDGFAGLPGNITDNPIFSGFAPLFTSVNTLINQANANAAPGTTAIPSISTITFTNPAYTNGKFGQAWTSVFENRYPTYTAQLALSLPLQNSKARGEMAVAKELQRQADLQQSQTIMGLLTDARNAVQAFDTSKQRLASAHAARLASERVLQGEMNRFAAGRSTTFLVLQRQVQAASSQGREVQAQTDLNKAVSALDRVSGNIFATHGISFQRPGNAELQARFSAAGLPVPIFSTDAPTTKSAVAGAKKANAVSTNASSSSANATSTKSSGGSSSNASPSGSSASSARSSDSSSNANSPASSSSNANSTSASPSNANPSSASSSNGGSSDAASPNNAATGGSSASAGASGGVPAR